MTTAGDSEKLSALLIEFRWGDPASPTYYRITDFTSDLTYQSLTYAAEPRFELKGLEVSGIFDSDKPVQFTLPLVAGGISDQATNGQRHSPIYVTLLEKLSSTSGGADQVLTLFKGKVIRAVRNYNGRPDFVLFEAFATKQRLGIPLGLIASHNCQWAFGGRGCGVAVPQETGTASVINAKTLTITGLAGHVDRYWHRGFVERDGLRIQIRDWLSGSDFELMSEAPAEWAGQSVKVSAGCDKSISKCRFWNNEANFSGFGMAMPDHNPNFEIV